VAGRITSMKNSNDTIGNRSRDLSVFSAVPQSVRHRVPPANVERYETALVLMYLNGSEIDSLTF
jgi:hypothetical protein